MNFKYDPIDSNKVNQILSTYKDQPILEYIIELWKLIDYQKNLITKQEKQMVSLKHIEAWKHYN
jgi:hypothetical protein